MIYSCITYIRIKKKDSVTQAGFGSRINWIYDPAPPPPRRATLHSHNSHVSIPSNRCKNEVSAISTRGSLPAPLSSVPPKKRRMRRRRQARHAANRNTENSSAAPLTQDAHWTNQRAAVPAEATQPQPEHSTPTSARRTAVYPPSRIVGDSLANENSPFQIGLESSRIPGLYKPAVPDQQQDTQARTFRANSSGSDDLGNTPLLEDAIETHGPPLRQPYRRQNPAVRREEMTQVQHMLSSNIIRPSNSPWASPVVMVRKKDGSLRFCVDFRQLNAATVKNAHPLPRIDDLLDALHGAKWFSTLDLKSGYWQVPITEQDKAKTAFRTSSGQLFEFNQVPFGLCNAPATFSRLMDRVLAGLHWETCLFYNSVLLHLGGTPRSAPRGVRAT